MRATRSEGGEVKSARRLQARLAKLTALVSGSVDCVLESQNNVARSEWEFAEKNLRTLFCNATVIAKLRQPVIREVRQLRKVGEL